MPARFVLESEQDIDGAAGTGRLLLWMEGRGGRRALAPGAAFPFGAGQARVVGVARWGRFTWTRTPGLSGVFAGFIVILAGCTLLAFPAGVARLGREGEGNAAVVFTVRVARPWPPTGIEQARRPEGSTVQSILFWSAVTLYALATVAWFAWAAFGKERGASAGRALLALGLLPHAGSLALRWIEVGHGPYNTRYEVISADTFIVVAVWLVATLVARGLRGLGVFVAPAAFLLMGWAVSTFELKREVPIIFKSWWLFMHIGFAKLFFAAILLAAACAAAWLVKDRNPRRSRACRRPRSSTSTPTSSCSSRSCSWA